MKFSILVLLSLLSFQSFAQSDSNIFSYYLKSNHTPYQVMTNLDETKFGDYQLMKGKSTTFNNYDLRIEAGENLNIDETGVYILKNKILNISRTEIRENSKYSVSNGYLHGIIKNDSIPVALDGELFYFLMPTKVYLFDVTNAKQKLFSISTNNFLILSQETNGFYSATTIEFKQQKVTFSELDLNYLDTKSIAHEPIIENQIETFLLTPTKVQWPLLLNNFSMLDSYSTK